MTVVAKIKTDRVIEIGVCDELVNGMVRERNVTIWGTNPCGSIIGIDGVGCYGRGWKERMGRTSRPRKGSAWNSEASLRKHR